MRGSDNVGGLIAAVVLTARRTRFIAFGNFLKPQQWSAKLSNDPEARISLAGVQEIYPASDVTIWRKLNDPQAGFPKPVYVGRIRYWKRSEIVEWLEAQSETAE